MKRSFSIPRRTALGVLAGAAIAPPRRLGRR